MVDCAASMTQPKDKSSIRGHAYQLGLTAGFGKVSSMERVIRKIGLHDEPVEPLIENREEAMQTFYAILEMGKSLYANEPDTDAQQGHRRVYRVVPLKES
jgi:hypothetical protein